MSKFKSGSYNRNNREKLPLNKPLKDNELCDHTGCCNHLTHLHEKCNRLACMRDALVTEYFMNKYKERDIEIRIIEKGKGDSGFRITTKLTDIEIMNLLESKK